MKMRQRFWTAMIVVGLALFMVPWQARAATSAAPSLSDDGWELLELPGTQPTDFQLSADGSIKILSNNSAAFLYREAEKGFSRLAWQWRVDDAGPPSDLMEKGADDRPLAVHLWFPEDPSNRSLSKALAGLFGIPVFGHVITYVWGPAEGKGKQFENPYLDEGEGVIIVLRDNSDGVGTWRSETIDFKTDFEKHFGRAAPYPRFVAVSADSDDLGGQSHGEIADITFLSPEDTAAQ